MKRFVQYLAFAALGLWVLAPVGLAQEHGEEHEHGQQDEHGQKPKDKDKQDENWPKCPVMGDPVDFSVRTMTDDGPVYFCCPMCIDEYKKNPDKFAEQVAEQRGLLAKRDRVQVVCPLSSKPIDKDAVYEHDGKKVYFCCNDCKAKYAENPAKYKAKLAAAYCYQTRCPVSGKKISPASYKDLPTGQRVYFCCDMCPKKFMADPGKYTENLKKQGIHLDVKKLKKAEEEEEDEP
jgi:YHS domain-containing protein